LAPTDPFFVRPKTLLPLESRDENVVAIGGDSRAYIGATPEGDHVQHAHVRYVPKTPDRNAAYRLLKSVPAPLTIARAARALHWPEWRSKYWLYAFQVKGVLIKTGAEYRWAE
jgi:hypothetical protein